MAASSWANPGRIFISYRREDSAFPAGWLYDRLCAHFGSDCVFKDVDSIDPGDDFLRVIEDAVASCQVLLALIGDRWVEITDGTGHRRLDDANDFVRLEIEAALRRDVRVIPILVGRAPLPSSEQLPDSLRGLVRRQAIELSPNRFEPDVARLVRTIDKTLATLGAGSADAPTPVDRKSRWHGTATNDRLEAAAEGRRNLLVDPDWISALSAFQLRRWAEAVERLEALEAHYPGETRIETRLEKARRQRDIATWSSNAEAAVADGDWDTAVTALEHLSTLDPSYPDVAARLEQAQAAQRRMALVDDMTALHQAGQWEAVVAAAEELAEIDPENPDPGGIVSDAKAKIRDAELADQYAQALNYLDQEDWQQATQLFSAIEQEQPGYREAAALITTAQRQRDLAAWSDQAATAAMQEDWDTAVIDLENICAVDPTFRDAGRRLEQARSAQRLKSLVDRVTVSHKAGQWTDVLAAADELAQLDPDHPDPGGKVSDARVKVREGELGERYAQGVDHLKQQRWQHAVEVFGAIEQEQPGYRDTLAQLKSAQQNLLKTAEAEPQAAPPEQPPPQKTSPIADLGALVSQSAALTHDQQHEIVDRLQRALLVASPTKRQNLEALLDKFSRRTDLYQDIAVTVTTVRSAPAGTQSRKESLSQSAAQVPDRVEGSVARTLTTRWQHATTRRRALVIAGVVGGAILVSISIGLPLWLNSEAYKWWQSERAIKDANVGDCIHREPSEGHVVVSTAKCQTSYATDVVIGKTDNSANCPSGPVVQGVRQSAWVRATTSPPIVLCLRPR